MKHRNPLSTSLVDEPWDNYSRVVRAIKSECAPAVSEALPGRLAETQSHNRPEGPAMRRIVSRTPDTALRVG